MTTLVEEIAHLDFDFALMCESVWLPCDPRNKADYRITLACCGDIFLLCRECLDKRLEREATGMWLWRCGLCGAGGMLLSDVFRRVDLL